jgi:hypothetical protein
LLQLPDITERWIARRREYGGDGHERGVTGKCAAAHPLHNPHERHAKDRHGTAPGAVEGQSRGPLEEALLGPHQFLDRQNPHARRQVAHDLRKGVQQLISFVEANPEADRDGITHCDCG